MGCAWESITASIESAFPRRFLPDRTSGLASSCCLSRIFPAASRRSGPSPSSAKAPKNPSAPRSGSSVTSRDPACEAKMEEGGRSHNPEDRSQESEDRSQKTELRIKEHRQGESIDHIIFNLNLLTSDS